MLLTISYSGEESADLGYLLHKNPARPQRFELSFGTVYVFYPEVSEKRCTAALLLDIDPLDLARGKLGSKNGGLFDYVNDRPYIASSFMSVALSRVYGTAMSGRCEQRQALADTPLDLTAMLSMLPCRGDSALLLELFEPLGYAVSFTPYLYDEQFPEWGRSPYVDLSIRGTVRLQDLLRHLYVLIPVFDRRKHYYIGSDEVDKLLRHGEGWLERHPKKALISRRYFYKVQQFSRTALDRLDNGEGTADIPDTEDETENPPTLTLNTQRLEAAVTALKACAAASVLDIGCGEGNLLRRLMQEKQFTKIGGTDVSPTALERAKQRLKLDQLPEAQKNRITLFQSSVTYRDSRYAGYDAAVAMEVIEHLDANRIGSFGAVVFGSAKPKTVIITTPNREYNKNYPALMGAGLRHGDHRFEWTRKEFHEWAEKTAEQYGYRVEYEEIGDHDETAGSPTQMGVFTRCE